MLPTSDAVNSNSVITHMNKILLMAEISPTLNFPYSNRKVKIP